jgi:hypothetical protein
MVLTSGTRIWGGNGVAKGGEAKNAVTKGHVTKGGMKGIYLDIGVIGTA